MKRLSLFTLCLSASLMMMAANIEVTWEMLRNGAEKNMYASQFIIRNVSGNTLNGGWKFCFNLFPRKMMPIGDNPQFSINEIIPGYYYITTTEAYQPLASGESVAFEFLTSNSFLNISYRPDGGHFVASDSNTPEPVNIAIAPLTREEQWTVPGKRFAKFPDGKYMYEHNATFSTTYKPSVYDIFPMPKSVNITKGVTKVNAFRLQDESLSVKASKYLYEKFGEMGISYNSKAKTVIEFAIINHSNPEYYELHIKNGKILIAAAEDTGLLNGVKTLIATLHRSRNLPNVVIKDYPDIANRTMMLDIARNFTHYKNLLRYIDALALYKINVFQFHCTDDEAWRLEIPDLPELTEVASHRGYANNENSYLYQTYTGNGNPNDTTNSSNGYITRKQFINLLQYADSRGIEVIPEIETPAHSRAAIRAMKARSLKYANDSIRANEFVMWDNNDTSSYVSAQGYHDNALNFACEGTYRFIDKVTDEIIAMYKEANVPLNIIHIGGDEVPASAWDGSPLIKDFLKQHGMTTLEQGREYYINRVTEMLVAKGVKAGGWQEVAMNHQPDFDEQVAPRMGKVNAWSTVGARATIPYELANKGYPITLSNVTNFYFDMVYTRHPYENGLHWGGTVDEIDVWSALPFNIYRSVRTNEANDSINLARAADGKVALEKPENIVGVQGQLWAETVRNFDMVTAFTYPKLFGLAERGWNVHPSWEYDYDNNARYMSERNRFNRIVGEIELPRIIEQGFNVHVAQPGIKVENGMLFLNHQYPNAELRYTTDGSTPTKSSPIWHKPVRISATSGIKAIAILNGVSSLVTTL